MLLSGSIRAIDSEIVAGRQSQRRHRRDRRRRHLVAAVRDHRDRAARAPRRQMILDRRMIGDEPMAEPRAEPFVEIEPRAHRQAPFRALPLDAVHVDQDFLVPRAQQRQEARRVVAEHEAHAVLFRGVLHRMPVELHRAGRARARHLDLDALDAAPRVGGEALRHLRHILLTVNRHAPAALDQEQRELLGEALEAAMRGRHAARSKHQHTRLFCHCTARIGTASVPPRDGAHVLERCVASIVPARINRCALHINDAATIALPARIVRGFSEAAETDVWGPSAARRNGGHAYRLRASRF